MRLLPFLVPSLLMGCPFEGKTAGDSAEDADTDADSDTHTDSASDTDTGTDSDTDSDSDRPDTGPPPDTDGNVRPLSPAGRWIGAGTASDSPELTIGGYASLRSGSSLAAGDEDASARVSSSAPPWPRPVTSTGMALSTC